MIILMTICDSKGWIFPCHPHINNGLSFPADPLKQHFKFEKLKKRLLENPEFAEMRHGDVILTLQ